MKKIRWLFYLLVWFCFFLLFCPMIVPQNQVRGFAKRTNIEKLLAAYPQQLLKLEDNKLYWKDGSFLIFDDKKVKTFEQKLENADIEDQLYQSYPKGQLLQNPQKDADAGRIRNEDFFKKMYGVNKQAVEKNLVPIIWLPNTVNKTLLVSKINDVDKKLQAISKALEQLPSLQKYVENPAGTFNWRKIANTNRLSTHSFGITIDITIQYANYWEWEKNKNATVLNYKNQIPYQIVEIFEKYGFIWGGKWYHYDTMHFEYRPELL